MGRFPTSRAPLPWYRRTVLRSPELWRRLVPATVFLLFLGMGAWLAPSPAISLALGAVAGGGFLAWEWREVARGRREAWRSRLAGSLSERRIAELWRRRSLNLEPVRREVTLLHLEWGGLAEFSERLSPEAAFRCLRGLRDRVRPVIHEYGGVVIRPSGGGLLCLFGYGYESRLTPQNHGDQALRCAFHLQQNTLSDLLKEAETDTPAFPLRIGLNTASVHTGNLADEPGVELTCVGPAVDTARRLAEICETGGILISAPTQDALLQRHQWPVPARSRLVSLDGELREAYEYDPLETDPERKRRLGEVVRRLSGTERRETRWVVPAGTGIYVRSEAASGTLVDFSPSGLGLRLDRYLGRLAHLTVSLESVPKGLAKSLSQAGVPALLCEVRWGYPAGPGEYQIGVAIKNLSENQRRTLVDELRKAVRERGKAA